MFSTSPIQAEPKFQALDGSAAKRTNPLSSLCIAVKNLAVRIFAALKRAFQNCFSSKSNSITKEEPREQSNSVIDTDLTKTSISEDPHVVTDDGNTQEDNLSEAESEQENDPAGTFVVHMKYTQKDLMPTNSAQAPHDESEVGNFGTTAFSPNADNPVCGRGPNGEYETHEPENLYFNPRQRKPRPGLEEWLTGEQINSTHRPLVGRINQETGEIVGEPLPRGRNAESFVKEQNQKMRKPLHFTNPLRKKRADNKKQIETQQQLQLITPIITALEDNISFLRTEGIYRESPSIEKLDQAVKDAENGKTLQRIIIDLKLQGSDTPILLAAMVKRILGQHFLFSQDLFQKHYSEKEEKEVIIKNLYRGLDSEQQKLFLAVINHLKQVTYRSEDNMMTPLNLAITVAPRLFEPPKDLLEGQTFTDHTIRLIRLCIDYGSDT